MSKVGARLVQLMIAKSTRRKIVRAARSLSLRPAVGGVEFGDFRRLVPISTDWGFDRGTAIDRYYIDRFLRQHAADVRGRVLEIGTNDMTREYGGSRVVHSDVLHVVNSGPPVTMVGDLSDGAGIPSETFDCILLTQTLQFVYDARAAVRTLHRILKRGGVAFVTVPGITKISRYDMDRWGQHWCFTTTSIRRLFEECFPPDAITTGAWGNVLTACAFLQGIAAEELTAEELEYHDPDFEMLVGARVVRPAA